MEIQFYIDEDESAEQAISALAGAGVLDDDTRIIVRRAPTPDELSAVTKIAREVLKYQEEQRAVGVEVGTAEAVDFVLDRKS